MVVSGMYSDLHGARRPLLVGLLLFVAGLLVGSAANTMLVLVAARFVQGLAVGLLITAMYVVIGEVYDDELRPRIFAALAGAWVIPGLVGPMLAGWITEQLSWRWVFGGLSPFVALGGLLILPSLRQLRGAGSAGATGARSPTRAGAPTWAPRTWAPPGSTAGGSATPCWPRPAWRGSPTSAST